MPPVLRRLIQYEIDSGFDYDAQGYAFLVNMHFLQDLDTPITRQQLERMTDKQLVEVLRATFLNSPANQSGNSKVALRVHAGIARPSRPCWATSRHVAAARPSITAARTARRRIGRQATRKHAFPSSGQWQCRYAWTNHRARNHIITPQPWHIGIDAYRGEGKRCRANCLTP